MSIALSIGLLLIGAVAGAWVTNETTKLAELRGLIDQATISLPDIRLKLGWARSDFERKIRDSTPQSQARLEELDAARIEAEKTADLIQVHAGPKAEVFTQFVKALQAAERARDELVAVANGERVGDEWDPDASLEIVVDAWKDLDAERKRFLAAAAQRVATRAPWRLRPRA